MIKYKKTFYISVGFILMSDLLCCYGNESIEKKISIEEYPAYFSADAWKEIGRVNSQYNEEDEKIVAIVDAPVEYIAGLKERNDNVFQEQINNNIQKQIGNGSLITDTNHGAAVDHLIAGIP